MLFVPVLVLFQESFNSYSGKVSNSVLYSMEVEKANYVRTEVEQNSDFLIEKTIERSNSSEGFSVKKEVENALYGYFSSVQSFYDSPRVEFFFANSNPKNRNLLAFTNGKKFSKNFEDRFKTIVFSEKDFKVVEVKYSGGIFKDKQLYALISSSYQKTIFLFPVGYSVKKVVVE